MPLRIRDNHVAWTTVEARTLARVAKTGGARAAEALEKELGLGMHHWILDEKGEPKVASLEEWARWFERADRQIARDELGEVLVSTVFLGIDHSHGLGPPVLWETAILGGRFEKDEWERRASSREEALVNHRAALEAVLGAAEAFERDALATRARVQRARREKRR